MASPGTLEESEVLALNALAFLVNSPVEVERFFALSGIDPGDLSHAAGDAGFLGGVLDYFLGDDALLVRFCESQSLDPHSVHAARFELATRSRSLG
jgi:hypothetical protein